MIGGWSYCDGGTVPYGIMDPAYIVEHTSPYAYGVDTPS